ncbi:MAG: hypothetical protein KAW17_07245 [Candidatus Eisenbacteria sp.]|nr:hypothetical protein [Candidatus Eisenbacteria bacterium]
MRLKWWAVPVVVAAVMLGSYGLAKTIHFPTQVITVEAHTPEQGAELATVRFNVHMLKCWGTSETFTEMMSQEAGVVEIRTYTRTNTAVITYDPARTSPERLAERINAPIRHPDTGELIKVFTVREIET